ncbi:MAG: MBOAT family O-acyltransferase [Sediminibacterium sp.]|nr:MBOAT family O-acyltransferase [Sediminibacterium sp.]
MAFVIFLPVVFVLYWFGFKKKLHYQNLFLLVASYFFYGWWSWKLIFLLAFSTILDYFYGFKVGSSNPQKAKLFLWLSIINNLGVLVVFKYFNFFSFQIQSLIELFGFHANTLVLNIILPIGISFYTFHGISYILDVYHRKQKPVKSFIDYAIFVSFFPLLVAGPIERASHLLPQIQKKRKFNYEQCVDGCRLILWGMFKKVVIADSLSVIVDQIFINYQDYSAINLIVGAVAFSFQIYGDFSGYSDIAIGTAKLFGFELFSNFRFPYFSRNLGEFWRRWHISLSSWFRDYLYIPLGGSQKGKLITIRNIFIIFLVSGFWHGASWNYIVWGGIHACGFLPIYLFNQNRSHISNVVAQNRSLPNCKELYQMLGTFTFVTFAWIFFRLDGIKNSISYLTRIMVDLVNNPKQLLSIHTCYIAFIYILPLLLLEWWLRRDERKLRIKEGVLETIISWIMIILIVSKFNKESKFIYFQF